MADVNRPKDENRDANRARLLVAAAIDLNSEQLMSQTRRDRVLAQALAQGTAVPEPRRRVALPLLLSVAAVASLLIVGGLTELRPWRAGWQGATPAAPGAAPGVRVSVGELAVAGQTLGRSDAVPTETSLSSPQGAELHVGRASVRMAPGATLTVERKLEAIRLHGGSVSVLVERPAASAQPPTLGPVFRVVTANFVVEVLGTMFEVGDGYVTVQHGVVAVRAPSGAALATVHAGQRWSLAPAPEPPPTRVSAPATAPATAPASEPASASEPSPTLAPVSPRAPIPGPSPPRQATGVGTSLTAARRALAAGQVTEARALITRVVAATKSRADRAEAETLRADCALVEGDAELAGRLYLSVADRFRDLPAGENAFFAAATVARKAGQDARATELLRRYAERYPSGRFAAEVRSRLKAAPSAAADQK